MGKIRVYNVLLYNVKREGDFLALYYTFEDGQPGRYLCFIKNNMHYKKILKVLFEHTNADIKFENEPQNKNFLSFKIECMLVVESHNEKKSTPIAIGNPYTNRGCYLRTGEICDISKF